MADIKIFVCCHQPAEVPECPLLVPIQVGTALTDNRFPGFLYDNTGDNISIKNQSYCELTAQYWAWKNMCADYYGFFHYRRYLYPDIDEKGLYRLECKPTSGLLNKLGYDSFTSLIQRYDILLPKGENMYVPVRIHYADAPFHHRRDLGRIEEIIRQCYPEYVDAMERYLSGTICYFGNIFIMKRECFIAYCAWLFSIMDVFDQSAQTGAYPGQEQRVNGYLAERLLGVYVTWIREDPSLRIAELPRVHFEPDRTRLWKKRAVNRILPPGSRRRAATKKVLKKRIYAL